MEGINKVSLDKIMQIVEKYYDKQGSIKLMLHDVQLSLGYISMEGMQMIAEAAPLHNLTNGLRRQRGSQTHRSTK